MVFLLLTMMLQSNRSLETMYKNRILFAFLFSFLMGNSQTVLEPSQNETTELDSLANLGKVLLQAPTEEERRAAQKDFDQLLYGMLFNDNSYDADWKVVKNLSVLESPDLNFKIFTYLMPLKGGRNVFFGYLLVKIGKEELEVVQLKDNAYLMESPEYAKNLPENWYGALYYDIVKVKTDNQVYYTLMGYHPDVSNHNQKVIDVIWFKDAEVQFGAAIFMLGQFNDKTFYKPPFRLILKYNNQVSSMLKYEAKRKRILMDHLTPPDAGMTGLYDYYGPDFTYDALVWGKQGWELQRDVKVVSDIPVKKPVKKKKK